jgi:two-component system, OmpR family, phosphate regulon response regulator PhoB
MKPCLLLVEDDAALTELLRYTLEREGFDVIHTADGEEAVFRSREQKFDIAILDWMVPGLSGIEICRQLRRQRETASIPIIMLTARVDEQDRIRGLDIGADDYITKPFSPRELVARIKAILRRVRPALSGGTLNYGGLEMDTASHRVMRDGKPLQMGPTEFRLLRHFLEHPSRVFSREQLLDAVWGHDVYVELRTVDVHIRRLRKAVNLDNQPDLIRTVRSAGYALDTDASNTSA